MRVFLQIKVIFILLLEVLNVSCSFPNFSTSVLQKCASVYTESNFKGIILNMTDEARWRYKGHLQFIPRSIKLMNDGVCSLSIFDGRGNIQIIKEDTSHFSWPTNRPIDRACCECGNCDSFKNLPVTKCARIFQYEKCNSCLGSHLDLRDGETVHDFGTLHDRIASVAVHENCNLETIYEFHHPLWKRFSLKAYLRSGNNPVEWGKFLNEKFTVTLKTARCSCEETKQQRLNFFSSSGPILVLQDAIVASPSNHNRKSGSESDEIEDVAGVSSSAEFQDNGKVVSEEVPYSVY